MKTKLLRKCRKKVKLFERNGKYYIDRQGYIDEYGTKAQALISYREYIIVVANRIFKFKPKKQIFI